jgi:hypothetical protein
MTVDSVLARKRPSLLERADGPRRVSISRMGRPALLRLVAVLAFASGCGPEPEPPERPTVRHLSVYDTQHLDTVPVPDPLASICERPRRLAGEWRDTITGAGPRVPLLGEFRSTYSELETPLRCVARTAEEKEVLLQRTPLADSTRWRDPNTTVLLASRGFVSHLGPEIYLGFVAQEGDSLIAHVVRPDGASICWAPQEVTYPISVVAIPASSAKVVFREYIELEPPCS